MERLGITHAFAFDTDFEEFGTIVRFLGSTLTSSKHSLMADRSHSSEARTMLATIIQAVDGTVSQNVTERTYDRSFKSSAKATGWSNTQEPGFSIVSIKDDCGGSQSRD